MFTKRILFGCVLLATTVACDSATAPGASRLGLSFTGFRPAGVAPGVSALMANAIGDSLVVSDGTNTLVITRIEVVAREIELRRLGVSSCDSTASTDDCESFSAGAQLVVLPLAQSATQVLMIDVPTGTYSSLKMEVHKVGDDVSDAGFRTANPAWPTNKSIRVTGFYNGTAFSFLSDVNFYAEESLQPNLVVAATTATNLTVRIDLTVWFRNGATGPLIDPATAGSSGANKSLVENNIRNSVKVFEDSDRDGDERDG